MFQRMLVLSLFVNGNLVNNGLLKSNCFVLKFYPSNEFTCFTSTLVCLYTDFTNC